MSPIDLVFHGTEGDASKIGVIPVPGPLYIDGWAVAVKAVNGVAIITVISEAIKSLVAPYTCVWVTKSVVPALNVAMFITLGSLRSSVQ